MKTNQPKISWNDYDLLLGCYSLIPKQIEFKHVKGHQGRTNKDALTLKARLNVSINTLSKPAQTDPTISY